jgi:hypothetical protein
MLSKNGLHPLREQEMVVDDEDFDRAPPPVDTETDGG